MSKTVSKTGLTILILVVGFVCRVHATSQDEISLFDSKRTPVAYIADDRTIYLWGGKPVAYLDGEGRSVLDVYGFNGKHLGWYSAGVVYDDEGDAVGGTRNVFRAPTAIEPLKGLKELKPLKSLKELSPLKPLFSRRWSELPLKYFLIEGAE
jgi:hypothetical protein